VQNFSNHKCKSFQTTCEQRFKPELKNVSKPRCKSLQHSWSSPIVKTTVKQLKVATLKNTTPMLKITRIWDVGVMASILITSFFIFGDHLLRRIHS
jgi:hypothetical protein